MTGSFAEGPSVGEKTFRNKQSSDPVMKETKVTTKNLSLLQI